MAVEDLLNSSNYPQSNYVEIYIGLDPSWYNKFGALWTGAYSATILQAFGQSFSVADWEQGIVSEHSPNYEQDHPPGRSESFLFYGGGDNRKWNLTLQFISQIRDGTSSGSNQVDTDPGAGAAHSPSWNILKCRWLDRFKEPLIGPNGVAYSPPPMCIRVGKFFSARCVMTSGNWRPSGGIHVPVSNVPMALTYEMELTTTLLPSATTTPQIYNGDYSEFETGIHESLQFIRFRGATS